MGVGTERLKAKTEGSKLLTYIGLGVGRNNRKPRNGSSGHGRDTRPGDRRVGVRVNATILSETLYWVV